jgi:hypothetical protein
MVIYNCLQLPQAIRLANLNVLTTQRMDNSDDVIMEASTPSLKCLSSESSLYPMTA